MPFLDIFKDVPPDMILPIDEKNLKGYGYRNGQWTFYGVRHRGDDFVCNVGTPVKAVADGQVVKSGWDGSMSGNVVKIRHNSQIYSYNAHLSRIMVGIGQYVSEGEIIALSGGKSGGYGSGISTGPHLHFHIQIANKYDSIYNYLKPPMNIIDKLVKGQKQKFQDIMDGKVVFMFSKGKTYIIRDGKKTKIKPTEALVNLLSVGATEEDARKIPDNK